MAECVEAEEEQRAGIALKKASTSDQHTPRQHGDVIDGRPRRPETKKSSTLSVRAPNALPR